MEWVIIGLGSYLLAGYLVVAFTSHKTTLTSSSYIIVWVLWGILLPLVLVKLTGEMIAAAFRGEDLDD